MKRLFAKFFLIVLACLGAAAPASAYIVTIGQGTEAVYLRVGDGRLFGTYANGNQPNSSLPGADISRVEVTVPGSIVGNNTPQLMTANGRLTSDWDGFLFCNPGQLYIGGFYRRNNNGNQSATLTVLSPAELVNTVTGETIPISQISWTSSGNGDGNAAQPVVAGTFQGGQQTLNPGFLRNTWRESCLTFRYANTVSVGAGTYNARVVYTLSAP